MTQKDKIKKVCPLGSVPAKVLEENFDLLLPSLSNTYNSCILENYFSN